MYTSELNFSSNTSKVKVLATFLKSSCELNSEGFRNKFGMTKVLALGRQQNFYKFKKRKLPFDSPRLDE